MRRVMGLLIVFGILWAGAYYTYGYLTAATRLAALCSAIKPGLTLAELRKFGTQHGLLGRTAESGESFLVERRTFGRYGCRILIEHGIVSQSAYKVATP